MTSTLASCLTASSMVKESHLDSSGMQRVAAVILSGGEGSRLAPLTMKTCKPAVSFGGKYRLIDVPISYAVDAGCKKIYVLTQFLSASLHQHLFRTYSGLSSILELLTAEQRPSMKKWFQGSADAVRQNWEYLAEAPVDYFLILAGDQLYDIDFRLLVQHAKNTDADLVVAALPVGESDATRMGVMSINSDQSIVEFYEKPQQPELLTRTVIPKWLKEQQGILGSEERYLASAGIYVFKKEALFKLLHKESGEDFGKHLIPKQISIGKTFAYIHHGYWRDIGTIQSYFEANMALVSPHSAFSYHSEKRLFARPLNLPPPRINCSRMENVIICEGSSVEGEEIQNSILGPLTLVKKGCHITRTYLMGQDEHCSSTGSHTSSSHSVVGENCRIEQAIIEKQVSLGRDVQLVNKNRLSHYNSEHLYVRDGIIIVTRGAVLPDGFVF